MNAVQKRMKTLKQQRHEGRKLEKLNKQQAEMALDLLTVIPVYVLHEKFGFGAKRLEKFLTELYAAVTMVSDGKVSLGTLSNIIDADTGIKYEEESRTWKMGK